MILLSIGLPGPFASFCDALLLNLARNLVEDIEFIALNSLEDIALHLFSTRSTHLVIGSRQPTARFRAALSENNIHFVLALDDPCMAVGRIMLNSGYDIVTATRAVASSFASLQPCLQFPGALVFSPINGVFDTASVMEQLSRHLNLSILPEVLTTPNSLDREWGHSNLQLEKWWDELCGEDQALISGAVEGYKSYSQASIPPSFSWDQRLFFWGDDPDQWLSGSKDISGAARCLFYGPFANIPSGHWTLTVVLGCSNEVAGTEFLVEVFAGAQLTQGIWQPRQAGTYEASFDFVISDDNGTADHPLQIRVFNQQPVSAGRLHLVSVTVDSMEF